MGGLMVERAILWVVKCGGRKPGGGVGVSSKWVCVQPCVSSREHAHLLHKSQSSFITEAALSALRGRRLERWGGPWKEGENLHIRWKSTWDPLHPCRRRSMEVGCVRAQVSALILFLAHCILHADVRAQGVAVFFNIIWYESWWNLLQPNTHLPTMVYMQVDLHSFKIPVILNHSNISIFVLSHVWCIYQTIQLSWAIWTTLLLRCILHVQHVWFRLLIVNDAYAKSWKQLMHFPCIIVFFWNKPVSDASFGKLKMITSPEPCHLILHVNQSVLGDFLFSYTWDLMSWR